MTPTSIVAYLALFTAFGFLFVFGTLLLGRFLRARAPVAARLEIYECGEPTIGSSFVQFDLRFYVVALLFIVFDVEAAFFFPWAVVFGQAAQLSDPHRVTVVTQRREGPSSAGRRFGPRRGGSEDSLSRDLGSDPDKMMDDLFGESGDGPLVLSPVARRTLEDLGVANPTLPDPAAGAVANAQAIRATGRRLALTAMADMAVFFGVLLVGFAYVWKKGDLNWVRAVDRPAEAAEGGSGLAGASTR